MNKGFFNRDVQLEKLKGDVVWDVLVIGGGATGLGIALDAVSRGYKTLLAMNKDDHWIEEQLAAYKQLA